MPQPSQDRTTRRPAVLGGAAVALIAVLAVTLFVTSRNNSSEVEAVDTTESSEPAETTEADEEPDAGLEAETEAMGEDDEDPTAGTSEANVDNDTGSVDDETSSTTETAALDSPGLADALAAGQAPELGLPFLYITADQDCDGCVETVSLYYVPSEAKASILTLGAAFENGAEVDLAAVDPSLQDRNPLLIAEQLAAAGASEGDYSIDIVSGLVTEWTLGGNTVTLRCLQVDTRPIDLRSEVCRDSLIG